MERSQIPSGRVQTTIRPTPKRSKGHRRHPGHSLPPRPSRTRGAAGRAAWVVGGPGGWPTRVGGRGVGAGRRGGRLARREAKLSSRSAGQPAARAPTLPGSPACHGRADSRTRRPRPADGRPPKPGPGSDSAAGPHRAGQRPPGAPVVCRLVGWCPGAPPVWRRIRAQIGSASRGRPQVGGGSVLWVVLVRVQLLEEGALRHLPVRDRDRRDDPRCASKTRRLDAAPRH